MEKARILERLIKEQGFNARSFSVKCGIPYTTLYGILKNGVGKATVDNVMIICRNLGITVDELEKMATSESANFNDANYDDVLTIYTRSRNNLSQEEKIRLARIILADDED